MPTLRKNGFIYKRQPKHLTDNEIFGLTEMHKRGYAPQAWRIEDELIKMVDLGDSEPVSDKGKFLSFFPHVICALANAGIRHGDLTEYSVIVRGNRPYLIDFAESRIWGDPRPDKRREGDVYWLARTMAKLTKPHNTRSPEQFGIIARNAENFIANGRCLDIGCGHADLLSFMAALGCTRLVGIDNAYHSEMVTRADLLEWLEQNDEHFDLGLCFSVLPYVDVDRVLPLLSKTADVTFIECQYKGDGPGVVDDAIEMAAMLSRFWRTFERIGSTKIKDRDKIRDIWKCIQ